MTKEEYGVSTETDLPTLDFAKYAILYAERLEVNRQLLDFKSRAAACGMGLYGINDTNDKFNYQKYERTHAGLQRFLFDLNAEEIWQQLIQRFSADLRELNWYVIRGKTGFTFYTGKNATELNYHEDSLRIIDEAIKEEKKARKN